MNEASKLGTAVAKGIVRLQEKCAIDLGTANSNLSGHAGELDIEFKGLTDGLHQGLEEKASAMNALRNAGVAKVDGIAGMIIVDDAVLEATSESVKDLVQAFNAQDAADIAAYGAYFEKYDGEVTDATEFWGEFDGFADAYAEEEAS